jgi:gas vesicle protein
MENEKDCSGVCCVMSFLIGVVVGGGFALLTAPQSGKKTRRQLMRLAEDTKEKAEDCLDEMKLEAAEATKKVQNYCQEAKQKMESTVDAAKKTFRNAKE